MFMLARARLIGAYVAACPPVTHMLTPLRVSQSMSPVLCLGHSRANAHSWDNFIDQVAINKL